MPNSKNALTGEYDSTPVVVAHKNSSVSSIVIGDENYGEGSSREHAAMEPRHMGVKAVVVKSFARIHETNLKKGVLALTFNDKADYDLIQEDDTFDICGLTSFSPSASLTVVANHFDGTKDEIIVNHTFNENQIGGLRLGSALNLISQKEKYQCIIQTILQLLLGPLRGLRSSFFAVEPSWATWCWHHAH